MSSSDFHTDSSRPDSPPPFFQPPDLSEMKKRVSSDSLKIDENKAPSNPQINGLSVTVPEKKSLVSTLINAIATFPELETPKIKLKNHIIELLSSHFGELSHEEKEHLAQVAEKIMQKFIQLFPSEKETPEMGLSRLVDSSVKTIKHPLPKNPEEDPSIKHLFQYLQHDLPQKLIEESLEEKPLLSEELLQEHSVSLKLSPSSLKDFLGKKDQFEVDFERTTSKIGNRSYSKEEKNSIGLKNYLNEINRFLGDEKYIAASKLLHQSLGGNLSSLKFMELSGLNPNNVASLVGKITPSLSLEKENIVIQGSFPTRLYSLSDSLSAEEISELNILEKQPHLTPKEEEKLASLKNSFSSNEIGTVLCTTTLTLPKSAYNEELDKKGEFPWDASDIGYKESLQFSPSLSTIHTEMQRIQGEKDALENDARPSMYKLAQDIAVLKSEGKKATTEEATLKQKEQKLQEATDKLDKHLSFLNQLKQKVDNHEFH